MPNWIDDGIDNVHTKVCPTRAWEKFDVELYTPDTIVINICIFCSSTTFLPLWLRMIFVIVNVESIYLPAV